MSEKLNSFEKLRRIFKIHQYRSRVIAEKKMREETAKMRLHTHPTVVSAVVGDNTDSFSPIMPSDISYLIQNSLEEASTNNIPKINNNLYNQPPKLYIPPNQAPQTYTPANISNSNRHSPVAPVEYYSPTEANKNSRD